MIKKILYVLALMMTVFGTVVAIETPAFAISTFNIWLENGDQALGSNCITGNCHAFDKAHPGRTITWDQFTTYNGDGAGYLEWSNGLFLASGAASGGDGCDIVTTKSSAGANGVIWALHISGGHLYYVNRYCDTGDSTVVMATQNVNGTVWTICRMGTDCGGLFVKLTLNPT